jgi:lipoprotein NlpI
MCHNLTHSLAKYGPQVPPQPRPEGNVKAKRMQALRMLATFRALRAMPRVLGAALILLPILKLPARAQELEFTPVNQDLDRCIREGSDATADPDAVIQACTGAVNSKEVTGPNLRAVLNNRGIAYKNKGDNEHAVADFSAALDLNPNDDKALNNRGALYMNEGDYDRAIADYDRAIALVPDYAIAIKNRGSAYISKGMYERAMPDYDKLVQINPRNAFALQTRGILRYFLMNYQGSLQDEMDALDVNPMDGYSAIWLYMAQSHTGHDARVALLMNAMNLRLANWPGPVVQVLLGKTEPGELVSLGRASNPRFANDRECEADFYLGERALIDGNRAAALAAFRAAVATGAKTNFEYGGAALELMRLTSAQPAN